jgi:membrane-associated protease RseP (regulator of RpoE activity)
MDVMFWDLTLMVIFVIGVSIFLYLKKSRIKREGLLLLYHTKWGIKFIDKFGKKHERLLKALSYVSVIVGYILMILMIYLFIQILWVYIFEANVVKAIKLPPITPLIPYLPQIFQLNFLPPFYFSYWIIILAIVAITHEFFHGIFARIANVKTKTTGFGFFPFFFPIFLAAFVNLDEKTMEKRKNFQQMAVLSAGTFANIITAIIAGIIMILFFTVSFAPSGVIYNDYAFGYVNMSSITSVNGIPVHNVSYGFLSNITSQGGFNKIVAGNETFAAIKGIIPNSNQIALYYNSPALKNNLSGAIIDINGEKITSLDKLASAIGKYSPGENVLLTMYNGSKIFNKTIALGSSPEGKAWIGITFENPISSGIIGSITNWIASYKDPHIYYIEKFAGANFLYDLLWWLVLISFSIALVNMLPVGIFDGGRFFYLTVLSITKSKKAAEKSFKFITYLFLVLLLVLMIFWARNFF